MIKMVRQLVIKVPSETDAKELAKLIKKQMRNAQSVKLAAAVALCCAVWTEYQRRKQEEELYKLSVRLKKLEYAEEE